MSEAGHPSILKHKEARNTHLYHIIILRFEKRLRFEFAFVLGLHAVGIIVAYTMISSRRSKLK